MTPKSEPSRKSIIAAWAIHVFTATGILFAFLSLAAMWDGRADYALWWLAAAVIVDSADGTLARAFRVTENTPFMDGALLDNIIDYITWTLLPLFWAHLFLDVHIAVCIFAAMASSLGFSRTDAKTDDLYFLGFPSYWNFIVLYLYVFDLSPDWSSAILIFLGIMVFIPLKWIYPSRTQVLMKTTLVLSGIYIIFIIYMLIYLDDTPLWVASFSLFYPIYYIAASIYYGNLPSNGRT